MTNEQSIAKERLREVHVELNELADLLHYVAERVRETREEEQALLLVIGNKQ